MPTNNAINLSNYPYYFCLKMNGSHPNVTGDGATEFQVPFDVVQDSWSSYNTGTNILTLPKGGYWSMGLSVEFSANYADLTNTYYGITSTTYLDISPKLSPVGYYSSGANLYQQLKVANGFTTSTSAAIITAAGSIYDADISTQLKCVFFSDQGSHVKNAGLVDNVAFPTYWWGYLLLPDPFDF